METQGDAALNTMATPSATGSERRRSPRCPCNGMAEVIVSRSGFLFRGRILDLSETGCFVASKARLRLEPSNEVELRFTLKNMSFRMEANVARVLPGTGVGLVFAPLNERHRAQLHALCQDLLNGRFAEEPIV